MSTTATVPMNDTARRDTAVQAALDLYKRQPQRRAAIQVWGADVQDHQDVKVAAAGAAVSITVQPVLVQLHHDDVQYGEWGHYPAQTWTVAVLLDPHTGEVLAIQQGTPNGKPTQARSSAVTQLRKRAEDHVLRPLVAKAVTCQAPATRVVQDVTELHPGQLIGAHGHGRCRPAVVVNVTKAGTVHYAFTTPTELSNASEQRRELYVTRGKAKAGQLYV